MNKTISEAVELARAVRRATADINDVDIVLCPPFTALSAVKEVLGNSKIGLGAQNMHWAAEGAYTGRSHQKWSLNYASMSSSATRSGGNISPKPMKPSIIKSKLLLPTA